MRKPRPSPPRWVWWDIDNCWFCDNKTGCNGCKIMKEYVASQKKRKELKEKNELRKGNYNNF